MLYAIYALDNVKYIGKRVLTNTPPCGAFRGHGTVLIQIRSVRDNQQAGLGRIDIWRDLMGPVQKQIRHR